MSNTGEFYDHTTFPVTRSTGSSANMRAELDLIETGFNKLPPMTGNALRLVKVGSAATDLTVSSLYETTSNQLLYGTSASRAVGGVTAKLQVEVASADSAASLVRNSSDASGPMLLFGKSRSAAIGGVTAASSQDVLGSIRWSYANGTSMADTTAKISGIYQGAGAASIVTQASAFVELQAVAAYTYSLKVYQGQAGFTAGSTLPTTISHGQFSVQGNSASPVGFGVENLGAGGAGYYLDGSFSGLSTLGGLGTRLHGVTGMTFSYGGGFTEGLRISSTGLVTVASGGVLALQAGAAATPSLTPTGDANTGLWFPAADTVAVSTVGVERARIDSSGGVLVGSSLTQPINAVGTSITPGLQVSTLSPVGGIAAYRWASPAAAGNVIGFARSRGTSVGDYTSVASGDSLGYLAWTGSDGTAFREAARISVEVDGTPGASDMPGRMSVYTTPDGSAAAVERLRITSAGDVTSMSSGAALGYGTGAGGTVTQLTNKSTGVTLNRPSGQITMNGAALAANTAVGFTLTNSVIGTTDVVQVAIDSGATADAYHAQVDAVGAGSCRISIRNMTAGSLSEAIVLNFVVLRAATA